MEIAKALQSACGMMSVGLDSGDEVCSSHRVAVGDGCMLSGSTKCREDAVADGRGNLLPCLRSCRTVERGSKLVAI